MRYLSLCSGIEAATVAWRPLGWRAVGFAEIEPFPSAVLAHHYPEVKNFGDFTSIIGSSRAPSVDLVVAGTPCQDFSVDGQRAGMDGQRGQLTWQFAEFIGRLRPRWLVWENVPGVMSIDGGRAFGAFLWRLAKFGYGFAYRVLDAQYLGVPQRRRRVFVVGHFGDWRRAAAVLFERHSLSGHPPPRREAKATVSALTANGVGTCGADDNQGQAGHLIVSTGDVSHCLNAGGNKRMDCTSETLVAHTLRGDGWDASEDGTGRGIPLVPMAFDCKAGGNTSFSVGEISGSLRGEGHGGGHVAIAAEKRVRRLTTRECERLQGFPDDYTAISYRGKPAADGPRYKAIGNSMAVPVMRWIGERIGYVGQLRA